MDDAEDMVDTKLKFGIKTAEEVARFLRKSRSWVYKNWQILGGRKLRGSLFFLERRTSMSVYSVKGKEWRYDFILRGIRNTGAWFRTKNEAKQAAAKSGKGGLKERRGGGRRL